MKRIDGSSQNVEQKQHAQANTCNSDSKAGQDKDDAGSDEVIPQQTKNKAHCFCPILAKEHGEEAAVILQGLGFKIAKSKKLRDGRMWHYDTVETLETKWPYLRDSGIHGILQRLTDKGNVFKGCYNKASFDPTTWYSVSDAIAKRALDEDGKLWFDVQVAVKCPSITAGTIYQNIRYHLLVFLADHPEFMGVPFHKTNKASLARARNCSESTFKRQFKKLLKHKFIAVNPREPKEYTICNAGDLVVPEGMKNNNASALKNRSSTDKNGSSAEMEIGSSTEVNGSSTEQIGSFTDKNGANAESNTHCKPFERPFQNTHSLPAAPSGCVRAQAADAAKDMVIGKSNGSATVPVKKSVVVAGNCTSIPCKALQRIQDIRRQRDSVMARLSDSEVKVIVQDAFELTHCFVKDELDTPTLLIGWQSFDPAAIISAIYPGLNQFWYEHGFHSGWNADKIEATFLQGLELALGAFLLCGGDWEVVHPQFKKTWNNVWDIHLEVPHPSERTDALADAKADLLLDKIRLSNKEGWETYSRGEVQFTVASKTAKMGAVLFFGGNEDLSAHDVWHVLADCVEVFKLNDTPQAKFDPFWKARRGIKLAFLFKYWDDIKAELAAVVKLAP